MIKGSGTLESDRASFASSMMGSQMSSKSNRGNLFKKGGASKS